MWRFKSSFMHITIAHKLPERWTSCRLLFQFTRNSSLAWLCLCLRVRGRVPLRGYLGRSQPAKLLAGRKQCPIALPRRFGQDSRAFPSQTTLFIKEYRDSIAIPMGWRDRMGLFHNFAPHECYCHGSPVKRIPQLSSWSRHAKEMSRCPRKSPFHPPFNRDDENFKWFS